MPHTDRSIVGLQPTKPRQLGGARVSRESVRTSPTGAAWSLTKSHRRTRMAQATWTTNRARQYAVAAPGGTPLVTAVAVAIKTAGCRLATPSTRYNPAVVTRRGCTVGRGRRRLRATDDRSKDRVDQPTDRGALRQNLDLPRDQRDLASVRARKHCVDGEDQPHQKPIKSGSLTESPHPTARNAPAVTKIQS